MGSCLPARIELETSLWGDFSSLCIDANRREGVIWWAWWCDVGGCPGVKVHPAVSKHRNNIHRDLRRGAVGLTGTITRLVASGLGGKSKAPIRYIVTSKAVKHITRDTTYTRGFRHRKMKTAVAIASY